MCLIAFAFHQHPRYPLIFAGNRDEIYTRSTRRAQFWSDQPDLLAGRDLEGGGTWLGVTRDGRFATVTNFRDPSLPQREGPSRGELVTNFLTSSLSPETYMRRIHPVAEAYNGFNLLVGHHDQLLYLNNFDNRIQPIQPGVYGLSNHRLNNDWPKVRRAQDRLSEIIDNADEKIDPEQLFALLYDQEEADAEELPDTGLSRRQEQKVSPIFIETEEYGTRSSSVILFRSDQSVYFEERYHQQPTKESDRVTKEFHIENREA